MKDTLKTASAEIFSEEWESRLPACEEEALGDRAQSKQEGEQASKRKNKEKTGKRREKETPAKRNKGKPEPKSRVSA